MIALGAFLEHERQVVGKMGLHDPQEVCGGVFGTQGGDFRFHIVCEQANLTKEDTASSFERVDNH